MGGQGCSLPPLPCAMGPTSLVATEPFLLCLSEAGGFPVHMWKDDLPWAPVFPPPGFCRAC